MSKDNEGTPLAEENLAGSITSVVAAAVRFLSADRSHADTLQAVANVRISTYSTSRDLEQLRVAVEAKSKARDELSDAVTTLLLAAGEVGK